MAPTLLTSLIALSALQHAFAETQAHTSDGLLTTAAPPTTSLTPMNTAEWVSKRSSLALSRASVSSLLGPFYETVMFAPGVSEGDWVSAVASGGENDETTTWAGYWAASYTNPAERSVGVNMTIGPTTYIQFVSRLNAITFTEAQYEYEPTVFPPMEATTRCSHTSIAPKISVPDAEWEAGLWDPATLMSDHRFTYSAECGFEGHLTMSDGHVSDEVTSYTMTEGAASGWNWVTVVGEKPAAMTGASAKPTVAVVQTGGGPAIDGVQATSTQTAGASEVTAWVNAMVFIVAAAAIV